MEHLENPSITFKEIMRVLKPGGVFLSKIPNRRHYMPIIARLTPRSFHRFYHKLRGRESKDTFPAVYKCNTKASVFKYAHEAGFEVERIQFIEGRPEYLRLTALTYLIGFLYERIVNSTEILEAFRSVIIFELLKKPGTLHA
jgi:SAM-dependent methyltransferase